MGAVAGLWPGRQAHLRALCQSAGTGARASLVRPRAGLCPVSAVTHFTGTESRRMRRLVSSAMEKPDL